jgi:hypothetical protein
MVKYKIWANSNSLNIYIQQIIKSTKACYLITITDCTEILNVLQSSTMDRNLYLTLYKSWKYSCWWCMFLSFEQFSKQRLKQ